MTLDGQLDGVTMLIVDGVNGAHQPVSFVTVNGVEQVPLHVTGDFSPVPDLGNRPGYLRRRMVRAMRKTSQLNVFLGSFSCSKCRYIA